MRGEHSPWLLPSRALQGRRGREGPLQLRASYRFKTSDNFCKKRKSLLPILLGAGWKSMEILPRPRFLNVRFGVILVGR